MLVFLVRTDLGFYLNGCSLRSTVDNSHWSVGSNAEKCSSSIFCSALNQVVWSPVRLVTLRQMSSNRGVLSSFVSLARTLVGPFLGKLVLENAGLKSRAIRQYVEALR